MASRILGADGQPFSLNGSATKRAPRRRSIGSMDRYMQALSSLKLPATVRARDPLANHPWVFAAAVVIANAATQARFVVFRETDSAKRERMAHAKRLGREWGGPRKQHRRTAIDRHLSQPWAKRARWAREKKLEVDLEHPFLDTLRKPNPYQTASQLWLVSFLTYAARADVRWVLVREGGKRLLPGEIPEEVWPMSADLFRPVLQTRDGGLLKGWEVRLPREFHASAGTKDGGGGRKLLLEPHEVIRFYNPDPESYLSSLSRIAAVASPVELDMLAAASNRGLMQNECVPRGVITGDMPLDAEEEDELREKWEERHKGAENEGRTAFLLNGLSYTQTGLSPRDMQWLEMEESDREKILGVLGTPPSVLGLTEFTNYATALTQSAHFYDKTVGPLWRAFEDTLDGTVFFDSADDTFGGFDVSGIDGLRAGQSEKIQDANTLTGTNLHVPPRQAFELVGLEVDEYPGDDKALVPGLVLPVEVAIEEAENPPDPPPAPPPLPGMDPAASEDPEAAPKELEEAEAKALLGIAAAVSDGQLTRRQAERCLSALVPGMDAARAVVPLKRGGDPRSLVCASATLAGVELPSGGVGDPGPWADRAPAYVRTLSPWTNLSAAKRKAIGGKRWREYVALMSGTENRTKTRYREWVAAQRKRSLDAFDAQARRRRSKAEGDGLDLSLILPDYTQARGGLSAGTRPVFSEALLKAYEFTLVDVGGVPVFELDDQRIVDFFDMRHVRFTGMNTQRLIDRVRGGLEAGIKNGETIQELRLRIAHSYDVAASSAKALQVARTETGGFLSGVREEMFDAGGFEQREWLASPDDVTRETHNIYGEAGPQPSGFNYMSLVNATDGRLRYPGDSDAPAREVINCRCYHVPV